MQREQSKGGGMFVGGGDLASGFRNSRDWESAEKTEEAWMVGCLFFFNVLLGPIFLSIRLQHCHTKNNYSPLTQYIVVAHMV